MDKKESRDYRYLFDHFTPAVIFDRYKQTLTEANEAIDALGLSGQVRIDPRVLGYVICDFFADTARLKDFHEIEHTNVSKVYSYGLYWFVRKKPIQLLKKVDDACLYVNERVAVNMMLPKMCRERGIDTRSVDNPAEIYEFIDLLMYNLKYRLFTAQTIELMLQAFFAGTSVHSD